MFGEILIPAKLSSAELDSYLAKGWYRMHQTIFTTHFIRREEDFFNTIWLRNRLDKYEKSGTCKKLEKLNRHFKVIISPGIMTPTHEALFLEYRKSLPGNRPDSIKQVLYGDEEIDSNIYHSVVIDMYDNNQLIASGFFDIGEKSAAGISTFYDPRYKKYSPGKYLIYKKIEYCKEKDLDWFYPGYFVPGCSDFDYKLSIGTSSLEYFQLSNQQWMPISHFNIERAPLKIIEKKLEQLKKTFDDKRLFAQIIYHKYFEMGFANGWGIPVFLYSPSGKDPRIGYAVAFDVRDRNYYLFCCTRLNQATNFATHNNKTVYEWLMNFSSVVFKSSSPEQVISNLYKIESSFNAE